jgi:3-oxoacyl-[acyl-carrier protein] reductase
MFTSIAGRSVLITGGTKGIGKGMAAAFAAEGAQVVITGRDTKLGERTAAELTAAGGGPVAYESGDVSDPVSCKAIIDATIERHGGIDVLCCNAGIFPAAPLTTMTPDQLDEVLAINLKGTFFPVQAAIEALTVSGHGRVIVTSSITGPVTGFSGWTAYGASKAGQLGFIRSAALEFTPRRITINAVLPGNIATEGLDDLGPEYLRSMEEAIPMRKLGVVADIAHAALFFATDEASFITGQTLIVDGGQIIPESLAAME